MKLNYVLLALCVSAFFGCKSETSNVNTTDYENSKRPANAITYKEMAAMYKQYDNNQKKVLDTLFGREESVSHFYPIDQLKQYIAYVERLSKEKNIPLTGIRIFSAAYPENYNDKELQKRQTLIFSPTTKIGNKENVAYEPLYSKKGKPVSVQEFLNKFSKGTTKKVNRASFLPNPFAKMMLQDDLESSSTNRLKPTPPR